MADRANAGNDPRAVLVTGGSSGIGAATAHQLAQRRCTVVIVSEDAAGLETVRSTIAAVGGTAHAICCDFADSAQVGGLVERAEAAAGPLWAVVNNAGIPMNSELASLSADRLRLVLEINFLAATELCRQAVRAFDGRGGRILNVTSVAARIGQPGVGGYSAAKASLHAYTQALRTEVAGMGIGVTEILPVSTRTRFFQAPTGGYEPGGVVQSPETVAASIVRAVHARTAPVEVYPYWPVRAAIAFEAAFPAIAARAVAWIRARQAKAEQHR